MPREIVTPPAVLPVQLPDLKAWLRIDLDDEDVVLEDCLATAVDQVQAKAQRQLITATIRETFSEPCGSVTLLSSPFQSIVSVEDGEGEPVEYELDTTGLRAVLTPETSVEKLIVTYRAGYGDDPSAVPPCARTAVKVAAAHCWRFRGDESGGDLPAAVDALLAGIRVRGVA